MRAGEKRGAEAGARRTKRGRSRALRWGEGSDRGEARRSTPVKGAVLWVVQVVGGKRRKLFVRPGLVAVVVCVSVLP